MALLQHCVEHTGPIPNLTPDCQRALLNSLVMATAGKTDSEVYITVGRHHPPHCVVVRRLAVLNRTTAYVITWTVTIFNVALYPVPISIPTSIWNGIGTGYEVIFDVRNCCQCSSGVHVHKRSGTPCTGIIKYRTPL